jgi:pimeloyl-ACP methyl ester carboxylesterase
MDIFLLIVQIIVLAWVAWVLFGMLALWLKKRYRQPDASPLIYFVNTQDAWRIAMHRYKPTEQTQREPIVLCHGLASNRFQVDLEGKSLARFLAAQGFDVWIIEFRGAGFSSDEKRNKSVTFDEYADQDLPACIAKILEETKCEKVHLVGYSTGALASLVYAARHQHIASVVALGAPIQFSEQGHLNRFVTVGSFLSLFGEVKMSTMTSLFSPLGGRMNTRLMKSLMNRENVTAPDIRTGLANAVENFSGDSLRQYADWVLENQLRSIDHRVDYRSEFTKVQAPLFLISGEQDILAPTSSMEPLLSMVQSPVKQLKVAGKKEGFAKDYGHVDLAYGERVEREVFVWIKDWLVKDSG